MEQFMDLKLPGEIGEVAGGEDQANNFSDEGEYHQ